MNRTNYAFDFCAEVESDAATFEQIPIAQLCEAIRRRLDGVEKQGDMGAFGLIDSYPVEDDGIEF
jgi:hypothetical protein